MSRTLWVYDLWSGYTDDTDDEWRKIVGAAASSMKNPPLNEQMALRELERVIEMKRKGVRLDYYQMNGFWFDPDGAYQTFRRRDWPNGPDPWLAGCQANSIKPGLWIGTNVLWKVNAAPEWRDSLASDDAATNVFASLGPSLSLFEGGYLAGLLEVLRYWSARGVRLFDLDVLNLNAATARARKQYSQQQIREKNQQALMDGLAAFRREHPDVLLGAYTGYIGGGRSVIGEEPTDRRWLDVFDTLMCGELTVSDVPQTNFWRSLDIAPDAAIRRYEQDGVPLERIDPIGASLSTTWYGYNRQRSAWKGMMVLALARGNLKKKIWGSVNVLTEEDVLWFLKVQKLFLSVLDNGHTQSFGATPAELEPYGYRSRSDTGAVYTVVNPAQAVNAIELSAMVTADTKWEGRLLFRDAGFVPELNGRSLTLGPGQMAVVGFGQYAQPDYDLGVQQEVIIPRWIEPIRSDFTARGENSIETILSPPRHGDLRMIFRNCGPNGEALRSVPGLIEVTQKDRKLPLHRHINEVFVHRGSMAEWYGLSWSAGEVRYTDFAASTPIAIRYTLQSDRPTALYGQAYVVQY